MYVCMVGTFDRMTFSKHTSNCFEVRKLGHVSKLRGKVQKILVGSANCTSHFLRKKSFESFAAYYAFSKKVFGQKYHDKSQHETWKWLINLCIDACMYAYTHTYIHTYIHAECPNICLHVSELDEINESYESMMLHTWSCLIHTKKLSLILYLIVSDTYKETVTYTILDRLR